MSVEKSIWSTIKRVLVVTKFDQIDKVMKWREALKNAGLNVHDCRILSVVATKKERLTFGDVSSVVFVSEGDFNFLGQLKNEDAKKLFSDRFDAVIVFGECPKKILKQVNKIRTSVDISLNTDDRIRMINLNTEETEPKYLLNFVKLTLDRIS